MHSAITKNQRNEDFEFSIEIERPWTAGPTHHFTADVCRFIESVELCFLKVIQEDEYK